MGQQRGRGEKSKRKSGGKQAFERRTLGGGVCVEAQLTYLRIILDKKTVFFVSQYDLAKQTLEDQIEYLYTHLMSSR